MSQRTARTAVTLAAMAGVLFAGFGAPASAAPPLLRSSTDAPPSLQRAVAAADRAVADGLDGFARGPQEAYQREQVTPWIKDLYSVAYERTYRGLPVVGGDAVVLVDGSGAVQTTQRASKIKVNVPVTATVSAAAAEKTSRARLVKVDKVSAPRLVVQISRDKAHLAWETVLSGRTHTAPSHLHVFVDARTGAVLSTKDDVVAGVGNSEWNGPSPLPIKTTNLGTSYSMKDPTRPGLECGDYTTKQVMAGPDDDWGTGRARDKETGCVDALYAGQRQWDMLKDWLGRDGLDGHGGGWPVYVGLDQVNAYWDGTSVSIGHNSKSEWAAALDVVSHENGHGIDSTTPGGGAREAGLGEGTGDIFGALTEAYANEPSPYDTPGDYLVGETANFFGTGAVRNMWNPAAFGDPNCYSSSIPTTEVHKAAGPLNHWFYMLAEGNAATTKVPRGSQSCDGGTSTGIGIKKAGQLFYGAMLLKTSDMTYQKYRAATLIAARELSVKCSLYYRTQAAWSAIGVPADPSEFCDTPQPFLRLSANPLSATVAPGGSTTAAIKTEGGILEDPAKLTSTGAPDGVTVTFTPDLVPIGASATMTVRVAKDVPAGTYPLRVNGYSEGAQDTLTYTLTVAAPTCSTMSSVTNGGFESKGDGWTASPGVMDSSTRQPADTGEWKAWFDGYGRAHTDRASQQVTIPTGCRTQLLAFFLHIDTAERGKAVRDKFTVAVNGKTLATYSNTDARAGYGFRSFDVSAYAGQTVELAFTGVEDNRRQTSFVVDDVTLQGVIGD